jgi:exosortase family protein XrtM
MVRQGLFFLAIYTLLILAYQESRGSPVETLLVDDITVRPAAWFINLLAPDQTVLPRGHSLIGRYARLNVLNGCEGTEALLLLWAAILASGNPWRHTLGGLLGGSVLVWTLNQIRIATLFGALQSDRALFELIHGSVGPTLVVLATCAFFFAWTRGGRGTGEPAG